MAAKRNTLRRERTKMIINKNKKSNWKPEKGSFRKIQESFLKKNVFCNGVGLSGPNHECSLAQSGK